MLAAVTHNLLIVLQRQQQCGHQPPGHRQTLQQAQVGHGATRTNQQVQGLPSVHADSVAASNRVDFCCYGYRLARVRALVVLVKSKSRHKLSSNLQSVKQHAETPSATAYS